MRVARHTKENEKTPGSSLAFLYGAFIAVIALAPFPLGSNRPLPAAILGLVCGVLVLLSFVSMVATKTGGRSWPRSIDAPLLLYSLVCLWVFLQSGHWLSGIGADPVWTMARENLPHLGDGAISLNPTASLTELMHLLTYFAVFWLSLNIGSTPSRARAILSAIVFIGAVYSLYGIITYFFADNALLIFDRRTPQNGIASTFVNRNNFATFAGMTSICGGTLLLNAVHPILEQRLPPRVLAARLMEHLLVQNRWMLAATTISALALVLTGSRGGIGATIFAVLFSSYLMLSKISRRRGKSLALPGLVVMLGLGALVFGVAGQRLSDRLSEASLDSSASARTAIYQIALDGIASAPWTGIGAGAFADVAPTYKTFAFSPAKALEKAHNTYLENAFELGIPAALALLAAIALLTWETWRGIRRRRRLAYLPTIGFGASLLVSLHSLVDFSLQIPAVAILYAAILGVAVAQSTAVRATNAAPQS